MMNTDSSAVSLFTDLLNFSDTEVIKIKSSANGRVITIVVKSTREQLPCRLCGKPTRGHGWGRPMRFRHLPLLGKETYIEMTPRRGRWVI